MLDVSRLEQLTNEEIVEAIIRAQPIQKAKCERDFATFVKCAWHIVEPITHLTWNWHMDIVCAYLEAVADGSIKRLIVNIPPGFCKSLLVSVLFPAWEWCTKPEERYLSVTNEENLAIRDALKMKQVITSEWYQQHWPIALQRDQNEKTLFINDKTGSRQSQGFTSNVTGKRGSRLLIDDPISAKMANSDVVRQSVNDKYDSELVTRLNDPDKSATILIMQRLHTEDLTGHLLKKGKSGWVHLFIPMRYEGSPSFDAGKDIGRPDLKDPRTKKGELMFPARFTRKVVDALEETLGEFSTAGQHQQRPYPAGGSIIKKSWWRIIPDDMPKPLIQHQFCSYDTAFSEKDNKTAAYSAMTRWGVFWHEQRERYCLLLLGCWWDRVGYDELRRKAKEFDKKYDPEIHLIEKKATGISLIQDLQRALPGKVKAYSPGKGEDKVSRAYSVSPMFESGIVFVPNRVWAIGNGVDKEGVIDYVASFPYGAPHTFDITDTCTQALIYLRLGGWVGEHPDDDIKHDYILPTLEEEEDREITHKRAPYGG